MTRTARYNTKLRETVIDLYGGQCKDCLSEDREVLEFDHVHGGGTSERKSKPGGYSFYRAVRDGTSAPVELVCRNCNWKRYLARLRERAA